MFDVKASRVSAGVLDPLPFPEAFFRLGFVDQDVDWELTLLGLSVLRGREQARRQISVVHQTIALPMRIVQNTTSVGAVLEKFVGGIERPSTMFATSWIHLVPLFDLTNPVYQTPDLLSSRLTLFQNQVANHVVNHFVVKKRHFS